MNTSIGLIGCGSIGGTFVDALISESIQDVRLIGILSHSSNIAIQNAQDRLGSRFVRDIDSLIAIQPDIVVEVAGQSALIEYALPILKNQIALLPMSLGAFADQTFRDNVYETVEAFGASLLIPSGAVGGLDLIRCADALNGLRSVQLTSTKKPIAFVNQPYVIDNNIQLEGLSEPFVVFEGSATEACLVFPASTNIAAAIALAGVGFDQTTVRIVADPTAPRTVHQLDVTGTFGTMSMTLQNVPHPDNPRTTYLACLGVIAAIRNRISWQQFV